MSWECYLIKKTALRCQTLLPNQREFYHAIKYIRPHFNNEEKANSKLVFLNRYLKQQRLSASSAGLIIMYKWGRENYLIWGPTCN